MELKRKAIPLPDLTGKTVLDVGCDHGYWCWLAAERGARDVLGLDRGRSVHGVPTDLADRCATRAGKESVPCNFEKIDLGRQWKEYGLFDVVLCFSMYHHVFENCGSHDAIWYWLWRHTASELLWENPTGTDDSVVRLNVSADKHDRYNIDLIHEAASHWFDVEHIGPALHVPTREVWRCKSRLHVSHKWEGRAASGAGGATKAFEYAGGRRMDEIEHALGVRPIPGSLNVRLKYPFHWDHAYFRAKILDVKDRRLGLDSEWAERWARFYPIQVGDVRAHVFRFEGERYDDTFVEIIADVRLRDLIQGDSFEFRS
jgi:SAM-dependent methyltransferase